MKIAATARQDADSLRKELDQLKKKLKEEEKEKAEAQARRKEREDLLHKSTLALLGKFTVLSLNPFYLTSLAFNFCSYFLQKLPIFLPIPWASSRLILLPMPLLWRLNPATSSELFSRRTRRSCQDCTP